MKKDFFPDNFTSGELYVIEKIWIDLTEKSNTNNKGIDSNIFYIYTNIDGLLQTRLFEVFDSKSNGYIDLENFIKGLRIICLGSVEEYGKFLFDIFDVKKESKIEKIYMSTILNSIPHNYICRCIKGLNHNINHINPNPNSNPDNFSNYCEWTNNCVCITVFNQFDTNHHDYLEWEEFLNWIKSDNILLKYIRDSISYQIQNETKRKNSISKTDILPKSSELTNRLESTMWKVGKRFGTKIKRYYLLYGTCLYYYKSKYEIKPRGVVFLSGSVIVPIDKNQIEISELNLCTGEHHHHQKRLLVCETESLRNEWIEHLQKASHYIPFESVYYLEKEIGVGAFSSVYKCIRKSDGREYAVKIIDKSHFNDIDKINLKNEISILKLVSHPNIIHMDGFYESKTHIYFVIEFIEGGDLLTNILKRSVYSDVELKNLAKTIGECLGYLHELGIIHRDIKPENILCDNVTGKLILTDFGLSQMILPNNKLSDPCGTLDYVAPEVLELGGYGMETDVWSLGIILYLVYYGRLPFTGLDDLDTINNIKHKEPIYSDNKNKNANDLISKLLDKNPKTRITAHEILSHPFIISHNI
jgi:tRNA A-37 threonylcarbamoyl transferase component Bud32